MDAGEPAASVTQLIERSATLYAADFDEPVRRHAIHVLADTVAVSFAGGRTEEMVRLREPDPMFESPPLSGRATVLAAGAAPASAEEAAFLNATAGSFLEIDEGVRPTGHPGMHIVPAALAAAEVSHRSGAQLLGAVIAGYEVAARLFAAFRLIPPTHPHGHLAGVGAAVAVALLLDEDPVAVARIAATTPTVPVWDACYEGATARNTATGLAARNALGAVRLHRAGFRGSASSVDALFAALLGTPGDIGALTGTIDPAEPRILRNYFKRHSACALNHAALDAVLLLPPLPVRSISAVEVQTVANNQKLGRQPAPNDLSTRFSLPYAVAAALTARASGLDRAGVLAFDLDTFDYRPEVARLAERVSVTVDPELEREWPEHSPARVVVHTGRRWEACVRDPHGHFHDPLTAGELRDKFLALTGERGGELWDRLATVHHTPDVATLLSPIRHIDS
ncbi:MmgE/PrpD family protein [Pseudonocardia spinosispora]|uniref:MmgE/PrpD family protein n=1 Tax=Pseudonocardia spinosispora TaxID=103441 RepID=UPI00042A198A|nr:MmgE/PrpD family protein [Pseudonocardia spinosispora]